MLTVCLTTPVLIFSYCRERLLEAAFTPQRSRIVKKKTFDDYCCFLSTFCEAEWNDPQNRSNSLKSIGFMCKSDHGVWHSFQIRCHFSLILICKLSIWGWNVKLPKSVIVSKSIGNMYKTNTSKLWHFWCQSRLLLLFLVMYCHFGLNFFTKWSIYLLNDQILY